MSKTWRHTRFIIYLFAMVVTSLPRYGYKALLYCVEFKVGERVEDRHAE